MAKNRSRSIGTTGHAFPENDSVVIYYAGHREIDQAYWLPVDAESDNFSTWVSANDITDQLRLMNARHVLVVADSCYSGALLRGGPAQDVARDSTEDGRKRFLQEMAYRRSRIIISSGSNEPVADGGGDGHSVFARAFLNALARTRDGGATSTEIFSKNIQPIVVGRSKQSPQHRPIPNSGHDGGDFVFWHGALPSAPR